MAKTKIGKVGITPKGAYSNVKNYVRLDVVTENGSSYVCLKDCVGKSVTDTEYWQLVAEKGDKGDKPVTGVDYNTDAEKTEFKNEVVTETKTDIADYVTEQKTELSTHTETKKSELDEYESTKETELNTKATELTNAFNTNATSKTKDYNDNATAKTTAFDNNATEKITAYNDNATTKTNEFNENVDSLNNKITKLENENDDLYNALYTEKTNGTEIYIDDAKKCRLVNTEICGKYMQETTSGKNLIDFSNCTGTTLEVQYAFKENVATVTQNAPRSFAGAFFDILNLLKNNASKKLKFVYKEIDITNFTSTNKRAVQIEYTENRTTKYAPLLDVDKTTYTFTIPDITDNITRASLKIFTNNSKDSIGNISCIKIYEPMLIFADISDETYEKYTGSIASPNPDYPQEIEQVESVKLRCTGSNLFDYTKISNVSTSSSGIAIKIEENGDIAISGKPKASYFQIVPNQDITSILQDGETYFLKQSNANDYSCFRLELNAIKEDGSITYLSAANGLRSFVVDKTTFKKYVIKVICGSLSDWGTEEKNIVSNFALIRQKKSDFEKYVSKTINIDLKGNKLCAVSDVIKDKLLIDRNGNVALQKNVEYVKFTNKDGWQTNGTTDNRHGYITPVLNILPNTSEKNCISNIAIISNPANSNTNAVLAGTTAMSKLRLYIPKKFLNTELSQLEALNELLQKTPMEIYYELATPEIIDLGQLSELPETFEGTNNIWAETNLGNTEIEIEYVQDVKKLIEQTQAMIINNASEEVAQ